MRRLVVSLVLATLALSACQTQERAEVRPVRPQGIEGRWASVGGPVAYTATFQNGRFTSVEQATNGLLASGNYTDLGPGQVNLLYTSITRNQQVSANCNQVAINRLSCATSSGSRFELVRV